MSARGLPIFDYPDNPGHRRSGGSKAGADHVRPNVRYLRARIMDILATGVELTADEMAAKLSESPLSIRPRFTELKLQGRIEQTGKRRKNASGVSAAVWRAVP